MSENCINKQAEQVKLTDIVCPQCFSQLSNATIIEPTIDRYNRTTRQYFAWCLKCERGYEVIQFLINDHWHIHKYRLYKVIGQTINCEPIGNWITVEDLPEAPLMVIGSGGDYDKQIDLKGLLEALRTALNSTTKVLEELKRDGENSS